MRNESQKTYLLRIHSDDFGDSVDDRAVKQPIWVSHLRTHGQSFIDRVSLGHPRHPMNLTKIVDEGVSDSVHHLLDIRFSAGFHSLLDVDGRQNFAEKEFGVREAF